MLECQLAYDANRGRPAAEQLPALARACAELHVEPACRAAWMKMGDAKTPKAERPRALARTIHACRAAYCSKLPAPRPRLCGAPTQSVPLMVQWAELHRAIVAFDLGPALVERLTVLRDPNVGVLFGTRPRARPALKKGSGALDLVVSVTSRWLVLWSQSGLEGTREQPAGVFPRLRVRKEGTTEVPVFDYARLNAKLHEIVRRRWPDASKRPAETKQITVEAVGTVADAAVIDVMDHVQRVEASPGAPAGPPPAELGRELFPDVQFSAIPPRPKLPPEIQRRLRSRPR